VIEKERADVLCEAQEVLPPKFEAGVFLVDKPAGPTSFAIVHRMRRVLGIKDRKSVV
jgi:tRNA U55 pseudouridine synthase TruB